MSKAAQEPPLEPPPAAVPPGIDALAGAARAGAAKGPPPVHLWNPPFCGDLDIRIAADGTWFYLGTPIGREALVRLFASILRKDDDGRTYLVTPVEKIGITVDDAPFVAVDVEAETHGDETALVFLTNVGDRVTLGRDHPLRFDTDWAAVASRPYVLVRGRLEALVDRKTFYRLVELGEMRRGDGGRPVFGVASLGAFFPLAEGETLEAAAGGWPPVGDAQNSGDAPNTGDAHDR